MKAKIFILAFLTSILSGDILAQDKTTVTATNTDISDNLDLRAVASIFGDSKDLEDFERRLNDPKTQISNLDLNGDNQVDYLRVIESVEGNTHLIIIQSVLQKDIFQDVATLEIEKDSNNQVQVQVVGDVYMYGNNYIYEPIYVHTPVIYDNFWGSGYRPYYSSWYWGYYPSYYYGWNPYPIYRYRNNVNYYINVNNNYNYVNVRRSQRAVALYNGRRSNGYEAQHPNRSFAQRNSNVKNRYELDQVRSSEGTRKPFSTVRGKTNTSTGNVRSSSPTRVNSGTRTQQSSGTRAVTPNTKSFTGSRSVTTSGTPSSTNTPRSQSPVTKTEPVRSNPSNVNTPSIPRAPAPKPASPVLMQDTRVNSQPSVQPSRSNSAPVRSNPSTQSNNAPQRSSGGRR